MYLAGDNYVPWDRSLLLKVGSLAAAAGLGSCKNPSRDRDERLFHFSSSFLSLLPTAAAATSTPRHNFPRTRIISDSAASNAGLENPLPERVCASAAYFRPSQRSIAIVRAIKNQTTTTTTPISSRNGKIAIFIGRTGRRRGRGNRFRRFPPHKAVIQR